jgi:hypothetical protein
MAQSAINGPVYVDQGRTFSSLTLAGTKAKTNWDAKAKKPVANLTDDGQQRWTIGCMVNFPDSGDRQHDFQVINVNVVGADDHTDPCEGWEPGTRIVFEDLTLGQMTSRQDGSIITYWSARSVRKAPPKASGQGQ